MTLTEKQMDDINILLTDVSLELLGNKFFDIHGQQSNNLAELCITNQKHPNISSACDFFEYLGSAKSLALTQKLQQPSMPLTSQQNAQIQLKSKSTDSLVNNSGSGDDSVVVGDGAHKISSPPSQQRAKRAKRQTTNTSLLAINQPLITSPAILLDDEPEIATGTNVAPNSILSFEDLMKKNIAIQYDQMRRESQHLRMHHFHEKKSLRKKSDPPLGLADINNLIEEYHKKELEQLKRDSISLIEFIKFVKSQPDNVKKMDEISANILLITDRV